MSVRGATDPYARLACHLHVRRAALLDRWHAMVQADGRLSTAAALRRRQFYDHIPVVLDALERELVARGRHAAIVTANAPMEAEGAASHGRVRWQQGYALAEVVREWGLLNACLLDEIAAVAPKGDYDAAVLLAAQAVVSRLCHEGVGDAAVEYRRLEQAAAADRITDLQHALEHVHEVERARARLWHEAAHDLRGNVGVVQNAAQVLTRAAREGDQWQRSMRLLRSGLDGLSALLEDLLQLARLEAGREQRHIQPFDAAHELRDLAQSLEPLADAKGLFLRFEGPADLPVEGDRVKVRRIAQNLLLNALRYTTEGGVVLRWESCSGAPPTWCFTLLDTGPGFADSAAPLLARELEAATDESRAVDAHGPSVGERAPAARSERRDPAGMPGEGVGLSIVKHLCELLDATLEVESAAGRGSTVRVVLPIRDGGEKRVDHGGSG